MMNVERVSIEIRRSLFNVRNFYFFSVRNCLFLVHTDETRVLTKELVKIVNRETYDLEDRLIDFSVLAINVGEALPKTDAGRYLSGQIIRSGMSPALVYGEAQSAESRKDFIHKISIMLKELRETRINMKIILKKGFLKDRCLLNNGLQEVNELISIFVKSLQTAKKNGRRNV